STSRAIDVSGWQIQAGIEYTFPSGTIIQPQGYLVVANDPAQFTNENQIPSAVLGPFSGSLSNRSDMIRLVDSRGNLADEVQYFDGGRWSDRADGGGSSLELRDPLAANERPESWAASAKNGTPQWQTISYQGIAQPDGTTNGVTSRYQEFIMGLLDAGEFLIDDISIVEAPSGAAIERVQNGSFDGDELGAEPEHWRIQGTHHGQVVVDPLDPENHVLHVAATGVMEDRFNHAEATFADGAAIQLGQEYLISFRAMWLSGSNQLTTRLYFNRVAKTHQLDRSTSVGTPGARNSQAIENAGPTISKLSHHPAVPDAEQPVEVVAQAADPQSVGRLLLSYSVQEGDWQHVEMQSNGRGEYRGEIPGQAAATTVQFYVTAIDGWAASSQFPSDGAGSRALYRVQDGRASQRGLHNFRIVMTPSDLTRLHSRTNILSNDRIGATVIYDESEVFYDVGVRLKGSNAGRGDNTYVGFNVQFDPMQLFRGVHDSVAIDRSGRSSPTPNTQDEILIKHIANHAGDIPMMYDDLVYVVTNN
ncbi:MAG: lamin tail domain-containing protein, partial [Planctomycetales bacterium]|nr:lamin tail domain-containing protein [Planctomycetales bacterium]